MQTLSSLIEEASEDQVVCWGTGRSLRYPSGEEFEKGPLFQL